MDNLTEDILKLLFAVALGSIIGAEREYRTKSAGFRTIILVTIGATIFTILSVRLGMANPDRMAANIITGIGFLGAGAIFRSENHVKGVTTAATIWLAAALGLAVGAGEYYLALFATVIVMLVMNVFPIFENLIDKFSEYRTYKITCAFQEETLFHYEQVFRDCGLSVSRGKQSRTGANIVGTWELHGSKANHEKLIALLMKDNDILAFDF